MTNITLKDILDLIFEAITAFAVIFAAIQIKINRKQLNISVLEKCINAFRQLGGFDYDTKDIGLVKKYIDLLNEELFYMHRGYLPKDVMKEWLDGVIDYMPLFDKITGTILNPENCVQLIKERHSNLLHSFPRVRYTFSLTGKYDLSKIYNKESIEDLSRVAERKKLVKELLKNLKKFDIYD